MKKKSESKSSRCSRDGSGCGGGGGSGCAAVVLMALFFLSGFLYCAMTVYTDTKKREVVHNEE